MRSSAAGKPAGPHQLIRAEAAVLSDSHTCGAHFTAAAPLKSQPLGFAHLPGDAAPAALLLRLGIGATVVRVSPPCSRATECGACHPK